MIAFDLICSRGHKFERWFKNGVSFEEERFDGLIRCPVCRDNQVEKAISSFGVRRHGGRKEQPQAPAQEERPDPEKLRHALQVLTQYVNQNFENVGVNFTREALKIHFGDAEKRNIRGVALPGEEKVLEEEGVPFVKIPVLKDQDN
ncbi:MAG TPA: DUF1178 family protein [Thermodesulfobacteriota bacterium]|nr:DUF1178 family protein [Thermodesulfobacteriota bacterium]